MQSIMRKRSNHIAPDRPGTTITREAHCMDCMPGHQGFFHISLALITSRANKRGGVIKYLKYKRVGNCYIQTNDLQVERLFQKAQIRKIVIGTSVTMKSGAK